MIVYLVVIMELGELTVPVSIWLKDGFRLSFRMRIECGSLLLGIAWRRCRLLVRAKIPEAATVCTGNDKCSVTSELIVRRAVKWRLLKYVWCLYLTHSGKHHSAMVELFKTKLLLWIGKDEVWCWWYQPPNRTALLTMQLVSKESCHLSEKYYFSLYGLTPNGSSLDHLLLSL